MHRGRFGGNARKRKIQLTDATFDAMINSPQQGEATVLEVVSETTLLEIETENMLLEAPAAPDFPQPSFVPFLPVRAARQRHEPRPFACQDYEFGYATCQTCRNDQAYYVHRQDLSAGYTFRCRVCRHELTVTKN